MRLLLGIILGFLLAVAVAYWHDSGAGPVDASGPSERIVNWDVADRAFRSARENVERGWDRLTGRHDFSREDQRERL